MKDNANDMEAVRNDSSIREPLLDEMSVGRAQVDADNTDAVAAL